MNQPIHPEVIRQVARLFFGALVAPDERRANGLSGALKKQSSVHLPGEADAGNFFGAYAGLSQRFSYGNAASVPPVARILFCPACVRRSEEHTSELQSRL